MNNIIPSKQDFVASQQEENKISIEEAMKIVSENLINGRRVFNLPNSFDVEDKEQIVRLIKEKGWDVVTEYLVTIVGATFDDDEKQIYAGIKFELS